MEMKANVPKLLRWKRKRRHSYIIFDTTLEQTRKELDKLLSEEEREALKAIVIEEVTGEDGEQKTVMTNYSWPALMATFKIWAKR